MRPRRWLLPAGMTALFVVLWLGGATRLDASPTVFVDNVHLRLVQPNVPQAEKYVRALVAAQLGNG